MIAQHSIQKVIDTAQVEDVIGDYVRLRNAGSNLKGLCPFHNEKTPSFVVSPSKNIYKCFGCSRGGGAVQFMMEHDGLSFPEAIRNLATRYQIELEETAMSSEERDELDQRESLYIITDRANKFFQNQLQTEEGKSVARSYFRSRGYLEKTMKAFDLGYAPSHKKDLLLQTMIGEGYNVDHMRSLGLVTKYDRDFFRGRAMFTIRGVNGKIVAFAGRVFGTADKKEPKYINSPESIIYEKRKVLYGLYQAKGSVRRKDNCILVEGYTDVLSLHQSGIEHVVASSGTALTPGQVRLIKRYTQNITLLYDSDSAGVKATKRGIDVILQEDMNVRVAILPDSHDPDSYIQEVGATEFENFLENQSLDFILFQANQLKEDSRQDPVRRAEHITEVIKSIALISDPIRRSLYVRECSDIFSIPERAVIESLNKALRQQLKEKQRDKLRQERIKRREEGASGSDFGEAPLPTDTDIPLPGESVEQDLTPHDISYWQEKDLIRVILQHGHKRIEDERAFDIVITQLGDIIRSGLGHPLYNRMMAECIALGEKDVDFGSKLSQHSDPDIQNMAIELLTTEYHLSKNWAEKHQIHLQMQKMPELNHEMDVTQAVQRMKIKKMQEVSAENQEKIKELSKEDDQENIIMHLRVQALINEEIKDLANQFGSVVF